mmetsp:Transcript_49943/g.151991  ORF Transcript_49943/g.151991 Transcript_49943/m.151991 type:complete len:299 (+) Transcript_49943:469-1365(+)
MAPASCAAVCKLSMAFFVPAHEKPLGKRMLAIWQTSPPTACLAHRPSSVSWSRPATDSMACGLLRAASLMAAPRTFTNSMPCSNVKTPATHKAVYSPSDSPATHENFSAASGLSLRSLTMPAIPPRNMAGWHTLVSSRSSALPFRHMSSKSLPNTAFAVAIISFTSASSFRPDNIPMYCEPCPGNINAGPAVPITDASRLTNKSLPVILVLTQPSPGPSPLTSLNFKRSPLSSSSSTKAPWLSREAAASDFRSCPCRTRMPPLSAPPTTSQICGMASPRGERAAGRAARRVAGGRVGR